MCFPGWNTCLFVIIIITVQKNKPNILSEYRELKYDKEKKKRKKKSNPPSNAPATSAEIKKGEFAKTSLRKMQTLLDINISS